MQSKRLDGHFKWIKKHIRNKQCKTFVAFIVLHKTHENLHKNVNENVFIHIFCKFSCIYEGRSICNENSPVYHKVLYLHTS